MTVTTIAMGGAESSVANAGVLSTVDLAVGTMIAVVMATVFTMLSSGLSLIVTFVPGVSAAWLIYFWLYRNKRRLPDSLDFLPLFFVMLAVQFIHFAEEYATGFRTSFPLLYGGNAYSDRLFVTFNMVAYFIFTLSCILVFTKRLRFLLIPVSFFIVYGAIGNAISHTWWSLYLQKYFPGLVTAQLYWIFGPLVLYRLVGTARVVIATIILFSAVLIPLLTIFASAGAGQ